MRKLHIAEGLDITAISLGSGHRGEPGYDPGGVFAVMDRYLERGGNCFDTARVYAGGQSDVELGRWLRDRAVRDRVVLVTKGSHPPTSDLRVSRLSPEEIEGDLELSLEAIGIECSDLHLLHRDNIAIPVEHIVPALDKLVRKGKTRYVGLSNWTGPRIAEANAFAKRNGMAPLVCSQVLYTLAQTTSAASGDVTHVVLGDAETGWYRDTQFPVMLFGAQGMGWYARRALGQEPAERPRRFFDGFPENFRRLERLRQLAADTGRSLSELTTAYVMASGLNASVLCAYSTPRQLDESFGALEFSLTPEQTAYLEGRKG